MLKWKLQNKKMENGEDLKNKIDQEIKYIEDNFDACRTMLHGNRDFLGDDCKKQLQSKLEKFFCIGIKEPGLGIQGEEQRKRDTSWYDKNVQNNPDRFYWNKQKKFLEIDEEECVPLNVIGAIDEDTDWIMNQIGDPKQEEMFKICGLVVGHVQSGKTKNYISLIGKAVDASYKFIVVIGGNTEILREQTQERIDRMFVDLGGDEKQVIKLTTKERDFDAKFANAVSDGINFATTNVPILLVIKKNSSILKNITNWLKSYYNKNDKKVDEHAMLLIDDESDWGSINTNKTDDEPTKINGRIRELLNLFNKRSYVAYTATPFANIFIKHTLDGDLFPGDFIYKLKTPSDYYGAQEIFIEHPKRYLMDIQDHESAFPPKKSKTHQISELPKSLFEAIHVFCINIALRHLRGQKNQCNSMLVNVSTSTSTHMDVTDLINKYIDPLKQEVKVCAKLPNPENQSTLIAEIQKVFQGKIDQDGFENKFSWSQVLEKLSDIINDEDIVVREIHEKARVPLNYKETKNVIAVGGLSLGRGFTLKGLNVSYFIRNSTYYDTNMQMGRWFGFIKDYQDLCKIYTPREIQKKFTAIAEKIGKFMALLQKMNDEGKTPRDFGLAIEADPEWKLRPTAPNKSRHARAIRQKKGNLFETRKFSIDESVHERNLAHLVDFVKSLKDYRCKNPKDLGYNNVGNNTLYLDVDRDKVLAFIKNFSTDEQDVVRQGLEYLENSDEAWDVALYSGDGQSVEELGELECKTSKRNKGKNTGNGYIDYPYKIAQAYSERVFVKGQIEKGKNYSSRLQKALIKPVLMLRILTIEIEGKKYSAHVPAYGLCFPDRGVGDHSQIVFANTVFQEQIMESAWHGLEEEDDDV
ncbi:hypothetical protein NHP21005_19750 (plasmid) [Helicobacter sp. NHP21005]|nr:hypothetical protein NHP21005_19750 [Helicobacter sp. NHP21005]